MSRWTATYVCLLFHYKAPLLHISNLWARFGISFPFAILEAEIGSEPRFPFSTTTKSQLSIVPRLSWPLGSLPKRAGKLRDELGWKASTFPTGNNFPCKYLHPSGISSFLNWCKHSLSHSLETHSLPKSTHYLFKPFPLACLVSLAWAVSPRMDPDPNPIVDQIATDILTCVQPVYSI